MAGADMVGLRVKDLEDDDFVGEGEELVAVARGEKRASLLVRILQWFPFIHGIADLVAMRKERSFALVLSDKRLRLLRLKGPFFSEKITEVHEFDLAEIRDLTVQSGTRWNLLTLALTNGENHLLEIRDPEVATAFAEEYHYLRNPDLARRASAKQDRASRMEEVMRGTALKDGTNAECAAGAALPDDRTSALGSGLGITAIVAGSAALVTACIFFLSWPLSAAALITGIMAQRRAAAAGVEANVLGKLGIIFGVIALIASIVLLIIMIVVDAAPVPTEE